MTTDREVILNPAERSEALPDSGLTFEKGPGGEALEPIDLHFGRFMERLAGEASPSLFLAAALVSRSARNGNICLDLNEAAGDSAPAVAGVILLQCPELAVWRSDLLKSPVVGRPGDERPLILDAASRLYLYRYWEYETELARFLIERGRSQPFGPAWLREKGIDIERLREALERIFPPSVGLAGGEGEEAIDWQKRAALTAFLQNLTVITGGPGTGKTATAAKAILLILEMSGQTNLRIALTAPTGKAAARLQEAMRKVTPCGSDSPVLLRAMTIHRLLGGLRHSSRFRHDRLNPLLADVVVVDEASMVDLPLMAKLVRAMPENARLILLGDRNQLASVEAGAALSDICGDQPLNSLTPDYADLVATLTGGAATPYPIDPCCDSSSLIRDCLIELQTNYRFQNQSGIHRLSLAVNRGAGDSALAILNENRDECRWMRIPSVPDLSRHLENTIRSYFNKCAQHIDNKGDYKCLFQLLEQHRILCALRKGPYGADAINRVCERILFESCLIRSAGQWYPGRPVMITKNDYGMGLFNGDVGLILPDPERSGESAAYFRDGVGGLRRFHPSRLPAHETVHALTVHKSQGSEFDNVLVILPDIDAPVVTRELIYTAVTRARKSVTVWGDTVLFIRAVSRRSKRSSGLRDALQSTEKFGLHPPPIHLDNWD